MPSIIIVCGVLTIAMIVGMIYFIRLDDAAKKDDPPKKDDALEKTAKDIDQNKCKYQRLTIGEMLIMPENTDIRLKLEWATFLLRAGIISGMEYYNYLTRKLDVSLSDDVRKILIDEYTDHTYSVDALVYLMRNYPKFGEKLTNEILAENYNN